MSPADFRAKYGRRSTGMVGWLVNQRHVGTSYDDIAADIAERGRNTPDADRRMIARATTDALVQHRRNRRSYLAVIDPARYSQSRYRD